MAICYDFDGTLAPGNMQEYGFIEKLGMTPEEFWKKSNTLAKTKKVDNILAYMYQMKKEGIAGAQQVLNHLLPYILSASWVWSLSEQLLQITSIY